MSWRRCTCIDEVRQALRKGHWPEACSPELRGHVQACSQCAREIVLAKHFQGERSAAIAEAATMGTIVPGSLLWWRAQARRREAALARAGRPLAVAQIFALGILLAALIGVVASHWQSLLDHVIGAQPDPNWSLTAMRGDWGLVALVLGIGAVAMLAGMVVYLSTERQ